MIGYPVIDLDLEYPYYKICIIILILCASIAVARK